VGSINAVIFDLDGLLLDTERIALSTFVNSCRESGFDPDVRVYYKCIGTTSSTTKEILTYGYGQSFPCDAIFELWRKKYREETSDKPIPLKTGALSLLRYLEKEGIKKAVVTSTRQEHARKWLANAELLRFFDFVLGSDQILNGKPHPEIYITACQKLDEKPSNCMALEDSDNGGLVGFERRSGGYPSPGPRPTFR
jgi:HAD superfamily hydrolase (TIGR01509 family)